MEGKEINAEVASVKTETSDDDPERGYKWHPSVFRIRPFIGIAALVCTILCMFWSLGILIGSNGAPTETWYFQPTVYLAIATAISNMALQCALTQAAPISWWYKALNGSTIRDLELEYEAGQSLMRAIYKSYKQGRLIGPLIIASIACTLVVIDGPLLQRSSSVHVAIANNPVTLNFTISPEVPRGFAGWYGPNEGEYQIHLQADHISAHVIKGNPIKSPVRCRGTCTAKVHGPGLVQKQCHQKTWDITPKIIEKGNVSWGSPGIAGHPTPFLVFWWSAPNVIPGPESVTMLTGRLDVHNGYGRYIEDRCKFASGILEYHVRIQNDTLSFESPASSSPVVAVANNTHLDLSAPGSHPLELAPFAIQFLSENEMDGAVVLYDNSISVNVSTANENMADYGVFSGNPYQHGTLQITDPMPDIVSKFDELLLRVGLLTGPWSDTKDLIDDGLQTHQMIEADREQEQTVFRSDLRWFAGAAAVQVIALVLVLPSYWGWWRIGIDMTMSPVHTAKLFGSPLLDDVSSAAGATGIIREIGMRRVQLGVVYAGRGTLSLEEKPEGSGQYRDARLRVDEPQNVRPPAAGAHFQH